LIGIGPVFIADILLTNIFGMGAGTISAICNLLYIPITILVQRYVINNVKFKEFSIGVSKSCSTET
jgi:hypothetical protein